MKFVTGIKAGETFVGLLHNADKVIDLTKASQAMGGTESLSNSMIACIADDNFVVRSQEIEKWVEGEGAGSDAVYELSAVQIVAPIPRPAKNIFCVGKNYAAHAIEMGSAADIPEHPMLFSKAPTTVTANEAVVLNQKDITDMLDYEGELAVIIGKEGKGITKEDAMDYIFGYTILNDITARDMQKRHKQYLLGKSLDTSCPMGPAIVHKSVIADPHNLDIQTKVNDEVRQSSNTEQFIFDIPTLISTISKGTTLEPGDIIATGTPSGVGNGFKPPRFLQPGDVVEVEITGLGTLRNYIAK